MTSSSRRADPKIEPGHRLVPLSFGADQKFSQIVELRELTRDRSELVLSEKIYDILNGIYTETRNGDLLRRHGLEIRNKILFCGPPGCGKTITAEILARELALPLYVGRLDAIVSSFLGETASNVRKLFETADREPCVLFLDEFDALARTRASYDEHNELRRVVNSLLMMIDRFKGRGLLIAATNFEQSLDSAVWRRFDEVILFSLPEVKSIAHYLKVKTRNFPASFPIEKKAQELKGLSYADIERICLNSIKRSILGNFAQIPEFEFDFSVQEERRRQETKKKITSDY